MNKLYITALASLICFSVFAAPKNTTKSTWSTWRTSSIWSLDRKPHNGDTVVIPAGYVVTLDRTETLKNVYVKVEGTLLVIGGSLILDNVSTVLVSTGGTIAGFLRLNLFDVIKIGDEQKFNGSQQAVTGLKVANNLTGKAFVHPSSINMLPVKFLGYNATLTNNKVVIQWSTTEEMNADLYEVERSEDGSNWQTIAYVGALGNYDGVNEYSYNDKVPASGAAYYRVKQIDIDGKFVYTSVSLVRTNQKKTNDAAISIMSNRMVAVTVPQTVKGNVMIQVVSMGGQTVRNQIIAKPKGQIVMNDLQSLKGNYVIVVSDGQSFKLAKQVIL